MCFHLHEFHLHELVHRRNSRVNGDPTVCMVLQKACNNFFFFTKLATWQHGYIVKQDYFSLRECIMVLEIIFVGQCEVFVCLDFVHFFPPWL